MEASGNTTSGSPSSLETPAFERDSLDPEKADRMTRALETDSFDTKDIVATSG